MYVYEQKAYGGRAPLVSAEQGQQIIDRFKAAYPKMGNPRFLIYVNRELVNEASGLKPTSSQRRIESTKSSAGLPVTRARSRPPRIKTCRLPRVRPPAWPTGRPCGMWSVLFGRPLRQAGASLVDQRVAAQLMADKPIAEFVGTSDTPESRKDREAIGKIADVVIEVLIASKTVVVPTIADTQTLTIPDIQATAISLKESKILGQAASSEVLGRVPPASLPSYGVPEITDATALALIDDLAAEAK